MDCSKSPRHSRWIKSPAVKRRATTDATHATPAAAQRSVFLYRLDEVLTAARGVPTNRGKNRSQERLVAAHTRDHKRGNESTQHRHQTHRVLRTCTIGHSHRPSSPRRAVAPVVLPGVPASPATRPKGAAGGGAGGYPDRAQRAGSSASAETPRGTAAAGDCVRAPCRSFSTPTSRAADDPAHFRTHRQ